MAISYVRWLGKEKPRLLRCARNDAGSEVLVMTQGSACAFPATVVAMTEGAFAMPLGAFTAPSYLAGLSSAYPEAPVAMAIITAATPATASTRQPSCISATAIILTPP